MIGVDASWFAQVGRARLELRDGYSDTSGWVGHHVCGFAGDVRIAGLAYQMVQPPARTRLICAKAGDEAWVGVCYRRSVIFCF